MADWENIPRLDPALQDEIDNVQLKHNALVEAVRGYSGGSIAGKTNEVMGTHQDNLDTVATREKTLLSAIGQPEPTPSMLLDFASQTYFTGIRGLEQAVDPHKYLTVERATSKWVMGPQGKLVEVPPNKLAYEYDPVTGEPKGALIEESRTNLVVDTDNWPASLLTGSSNISFTQETREDPFGVVRSVRKFVPEDGFSSGYALGYIGFEDFDTESGNPVSASVFLYPDGFDIAQLGVRGSDGSGYLAITCNLHTGEILPGSAAWGVPEEAENVIVERLANGWVRIGLGGVLGQGAKPERVELSIASSTGPVEGDGIKGVFYTGFQFENNAGIPSSFIPTVDAPVTRAADKVTRKLGDGFNANRGTLLIDCISPGDLGIESTVGSISNNTPFSRLGLEFVPASASQIKWRLVTGTSSNYEDHLGLMHIGSLEDYPKGTPMRSAISWDGEGTYSYSVNGGVTTSVTAEPLTELTAFMLGRYNNGINTLVDVKEVQFIPHFLTETELQELTANG